MRARVVLSLLGAAGVALALAAREAPADPPPAAPAAPAVVLLEGSPGGTETRVVLRTPATASQPRVLGVVPHAAGSARRASLGREASLRAYVIAAEPHAPRGSSYRSALWRVDAEGPPARLRGGLTDASRPLVTARGTVLVQAGEDGPEPVSDGTRALRERVDALALVAVDPANGASRTVWSGRGMIAFLAAPLKDDEALVFHVHAQGAALFALDAATGERRDIVPAMEPLARDFSYDPARDELTFARVSPRRDGAWEVVTLPAHGSPHDPASARVRWRGDHDHPMPRALAGGLVALSLDADRGLAWLPPGEGAPTRVAPLGDGADEAFAESPDGRWIAFRHRAPGRELLALHARRHGRTVTFDQPAIEQDFVGFTGSPP